MKEDTGLGLRLIRAVSIPAAVFVASWFVSLPTLAATTTVNLISNSSLESATSSTPPLPVNWVMDRWGRNTASFAYPVAGHLGGQAAQVTLTQRSGGDAKWAPEHVPAVAGHTYRFSDWYQSTVKSKVTIEFLMDDGYYDYLDIGKAPVATSAWSEFSGTFEAPVGVKSLTVYHLLARVGSLTVDDYTLTDEGEPAPPPPPPPDSLILNGSFETPNPLDSTRPDQWSFDSWGTLQASFTYPVLGRDGGRAAQTDITQAGTGDAKWHFSVPVTIKTETEYALTDWFRSTVTSTITLQYTRTDGTFLYEDVAFLPSAPNWQQAHANFFTPTGVTAVSVFHLIQGVGSLTLDDMSLSEAPSAKFEQGMVTLYFDDGRTSMFENGIPILNAAGLKSTQAIVSGLLGAPSYVSSTQMLEMQQSGHEIGAHTRTHVSLVQLTPAAAKDEIEGSRADLLALGASPVNTFVYPYGDYNDAIKQMVKDAGFLGARSVQMGYNNLYSDKFALFDQHVEASTTVDQIKGWIDKAMTDKTWLIMELHQVDNGGEQYSVTPQTLQAMADYLVQKNAKVVTMTEGLVKMNP